MPGFTPDSMVGTTTKSAKVIIHNFLAAFKSQPENFAEIKRQFLEAISFLQIDLTTFYSCVAINIITGKELDKSFEKKLRTTMPQNLAFLIEIVIELNTRIMQENISQENSPPTELNLIKKIIDNYLMQYNQINSHNYDWDYNLIAAAYREYFLNQLNILEQKITSPNVSFIDKFTLFLKMSEMVDQTEEFFSTIQNENSSSLRREQFNIDLAQAYERLALSSTALRNNLDTFIVNRKIHPVTRILNILNLREIIDHLSSTTQTNIKNSLFNEIPIKTNLNHTLIGYSMISISKGCQKNILNFVTTSSIDKNFKHNLRYMLTEALLAFNPLDYNDIFDTILTHRLKKNFYINLIKKVHQNIDELGLNTNLMSLDKNERETKIAQLQQELGKCQIFLETLQEILSHRYISLSVQNQKEINLHIEKFLNPLKNYISLLDKFSKKSFYLNEYELDPDTAKIIESELIVLAKQMENFSWQENQVRAESKKPQTQNLYLLYQPKSSELELEDKNYFNGPLRPKL